MTQWVDGDPEVGTELGLVRISLHTSRDKDHATSDFVMTPARALKLAAQLNLVALTVTSAADNVAVIRKRGAKHR